MCLKWSLGKFRKSHEISMLNFDHFGVKLHVEQNIVIKIYCSFLLQFTQKNRSIGNIAKQAGTELGQA